MIAKALGSQSYMSHFTVPDGKFAFYNQISAFVPKGEDVAFRTVSQVEGVNSPEILSPEIRLYSSQANLDLVLPTAIPEHTDIKFQGNSSNSDIQLTVLAQILLVDKALVTAEPDPRTKTL